MKPLEASLSFKLHTLRQNPYFDDLSEELLKEVAAHMQLRRFERGEGLLWEGDPCAGLHIIGKGSVKLYRISSQGRQYIVRVLQEGDTCNEVPTFDGGTNPVNVETLDKSNVWVIDDTTLRSLVKLHPDFALKVLSNFGRNLRGMVRMVSEVATDGSRPLWTQEQLAAQLGTVREVVARSLKELERSGAIRSKERRIYVAAEKALSEWTQPY